MVTMMIVLTQPSPQSFQLNISTMDMTNESTWLAVIKYINSSIFLIVKDDMITINVSARQVTQSFTVNIIDDDVVECIKTINVAIMSVENCGFAIGSNNTSEVIIRDDDSGF